MIFRRKESIKGKINIVKDYPFDNKIFTQGLIKYNNIILVSSGHYNKSFLGQLDLSTGKIDNKQKLEDHFFAEGITYNNSYVIQLTWKENVAFFRNPKTLKIEKCVQYTGEGWGICFDGEHLYMSNGSNYVKKINNQTFRTEKLLEIFCDGKRLNRLNDLEYYNGYLYANVWKSKYIYKVNLSTGKTKKIFDCTALIRFCKRINRNINELNGIAHIKDNYFLISGKNWPRIFLVQLL